MPGKNGGHSLDKARMLFESRRDPCAICGGEILYRAGRVRNPKTGRVTRHPYALDVDHIVPTADGGTDDIANLQATHHICNLRAGAKRGSKTSKNAKQATNHEMTAHRRETRTSRDWL